MAELTVENLHKRYGRTVALEDVSFAVAEGELFGLLGPNGAGKSTLISILSCLMPATAGSARLLGEELSPDNRAVRRGIGIVPQDLALYGDLSARENLTFFGRLYGLRGPELRQRVDELLAAVALTDRAGDRVATFSGGMKRKLEIVRSLMHRPRVLFLDEPTSGLDAASRRDRSATLAVVKTCHRQIGSRITRENLFD